MQYSISYWCVSHIGKVRRINQDNFICDDQFIEVNNDQTVFPLSGVKSSRHCSLFGIFDGMGGEECGEIASYIAAQNASTLEIGKDPVSDLSEFCQKANSDICEYAKNNNVSAMGTTAAILAFTKAGITLCNIGDSKIFRFCDGVLEQISKDHVAVAAFGVKPPLSQNLGIPPSELVIDPYFAQGVYNDKDFYLICSDGLTDMVSEEQIRDVLASTPAKKVCPELLDRALKNGGRDNITAILCKIERDSSLFFRRKHST